MNIVGDLVEFETIYHDLSGNEIHALIEAEIFKLDTHTTEIKILSDDYPYNDIFVDVDNRSFMNYNRFDRILNDL